MKKIIISVLITILYIIPSYGRIFGFNTLPGIGIGYSYIYENKADNYFPKHIVEIDANLYGIYISGGYGYKNLFWERENNIYYEETLNVYIGKIGPQFKLFDRYGIIITPYIGVLIYTYGESSNYTYYNGNYYNYEYCRYKYYDYEHELSTEFIYGVKASFKFNFIELGGHISNKEVGLNIGFTL